MAISRTQMGSQLRGNRVKKSKSGKLSDLTGDGKVTQADVLKGRGVFKKGGKVGYHRMPDGTMMQDSEHNMKKGGAVKKYQAGGMASSPRPKMRSEDMEEGRAPRRSMRPRRRPEDMEMDMSVDTAVGRGNRASMREAEEMPRMMMGGKVKKMQAGGKVRGAGMAKKGVRACKMM